MTKARFLENRKHRWQWWLMDRWQGGMWSCLTFVM